MAEEIIKTTTKKKKAKRNVPIGQVHVHASFNNTIISITDDKGNLIANSSSGACGFRGSKKGTAYAAQIASEKAVQLAKTQFGLKKVDVYIKGIGLGRDSAVRVLNSLEIDINRILDTTGVAHGGVRPRKSRRI